MLELPLAIQNTMTWTTCSMSLPYCNNTNKDHDCREDDVTNCDWVPSIGANRSLGKIRHSGCRKAAVSIPRRQEYDLRIAILKGETVIYIHRFEERKKRNKVD
jgi:hypothetical protein